MNYWIWLSTIKELGPIKKKKLLEKYQTPENIFNAKKADLKNISGISDRIIENIFQSKDIELINRYEKYLIKNNIKIININSIEYPEKLRNIYDAPITLYAKGNIELLNNKDCIAIVGSRDASSYGKKIATSFAYLLSKENITVVSGLAKGIDTAAHIGAIEECGRTIAVLGNGLDIVYPLENVSIYNEILQKGIILSEYIVGTKPEPGNFIARNRIISGLSLGTLIVEAKKKSGSLITADFALEQGRNVYAIPGNVDLERSEGTNNLIKEGAKLVSNIGDILEDFLPL